jgi:hypothetical protein
MLYLSCAYPREPVDLQSLNRATLSYVSSPSYVTSLQLVLADCLRIAATVAQAARAIRKWVLVLLASEQGSDGFLRLSQDLLGPEMLAGKPTRFRCFATAAGN